jgi:hypothetical protein
MALINTTTTGILGTTVYGDGAGALTVQKDGVTQGVYGNIPAFSVTNSATQSITNNTFTKVTLDSKNFDTNNNFASNRFTPTVAGYYLFQANAGVSGTGSVTQYVLQLFKNGNAVAPRFVDMNPAASFSNSWINLGNSVLLYMNGTTDYVELYVYSYGAGVTVGTGSANSAVFTGFLVKAT